MNVSSVIFGYLSNDQTLAIISQPANEIYRIFPTSEAERGQIEKRVGAFSWRSFQRAVQICRLILGVTQTHLQALKRERVLQQAVDKVSTIIYRGSEEAWEAFVLLRITCAEEGIPINDNHYMVGAIHAGKRNICARIAGLPAPIAPPRAEEPESSCVVS